MVNLGITQVDDAKAEKHPSLQSYAACQSHAVMKGTTTFVFGTLGLILAQGHLHKRFPYALQWNLLIAIVLSSVGSYTMTRWEKQKCSDFWLLLETGSNPDGSLPQVPKPEEASRSSKTNYRDVME